MVTAQHFNSICSCAESHSHPLWDCIYPAPQWSIGSSQSNNREEDKQADDLTHMSGDCKKTNEMRGQWVDEGFRSLNKASVWG